MKKDRFNPKHYRDTPRIERTVATNIVRVWSWNEKAKEYLAGDFLARRWEARPEGGKHRARQSFESLEAARAWQSRLEDAATTRPAPDAPPVSSAPSDAAAQGPTFGEVYARFYQRKVSKKSIGTRHNYDRYVRLHFQTLLPMPIRSITSRVIDEWIDLLHESLGKTQQSSTRVSFSHELSVLRCVLKFYASDFDDDAFGMPLKDRHVENVRVREAPPRHRDLTVDEFEAFLFELRKGKYGETLGAMARLQFEQALRISEAAGVFHEDLVLDAAHPERSRLRLCRHVFYPRRGGEAPSILPGFKNSRGGSTSVRVVPLFPAAFEALTKYGAGKGRGLVFGTGPLAPFSARQIQKAYDTAFARAGLPYTGTHVLRHGGARRVLNESGGDLTLAQMVLGHDDLDSTLVYAKRSQDAFQRHVDKAWSAGQRGEVLRLAKG